MLSSKAMDGWLMKDFSGRYVFSPEYVKETTVIFIREDEKPNKKGVFQDRM